MKRILLIIIVITLVANTISVLAASTIPADVIVHFRNDDGWDVIAQNGGQIAPHFFIRVYTQSRAEVRITVEVNGKTVWHKTQIVDFMKEYDLRVEEKGALRITVDFEVKNPDGTITKYNIIRDYTIAQSPVAIAPKNIVFTPKQFERLIENIKMESIAKAAVMAVLGVIIAVVVRSIFLLLEWTNAVNLVLLGVGLLAAYIIDEKLGALYWAAMLIANLVTYKYVKTANLTRFLRFEWDNQNIVETEVPLYEHEGRLAIAFQDSWSAIKRVFKNQHVYLDIKADGEAELWFMNGEQPCYLITRAKREGDRYVVELLDAHTREFMRNRKYFEEIKRGYKKILEEYTRLKATMPIALREVLNSITPDLRLVKELVKPSGGESK